MGEDDEGTARDFGSGTRPTVFLVHGRDRRVVDEMRSLVEAAGDVEAPPWRERATDLGTLASIRSIIETGMEQAVAILVLLTPDEDVALHRSVEPDERKLRAERRRLPRPNVVYELGLAHALHPGKTLMVRIGDVALLSDVDGLHHADWRSSEAREEIVEFVRSRVPSAGSTDESDRCTDVHRAVPMARCDELAARDADEGDLDGRASEGAHPPSQVLPSRRLAAPLVDGAGHLRLLAVEGGSLGLALPDDRSGRVSSSVAVPEGTHQLVLADDGTFVVLDGPDQLVACGVSVNGRPTERLPAEPREVDLVRVHAVQGRGSSVRILGDDRRGPVVLALHRDGRATWRALDDAEPAPVGGAALAGGWLLLEPGGFVRVVGGTDGGAEVVASLLGTEVGSLDAARAKGVTLAAAVGGDELRREVRVVRLVSGTTELRIREVPADARSVAVVRVPGRGEPTTVVVSSPTTAYRWTWDELPAIATASAVPV